MKAPTVSVIMPAYNHAPFVAESIRSVLTQDYEDLELLVADDGSPDETVAAIRSISDPRMQIFPHEVNRGAGVVTRELISRCRGKYIALINSDDAWLPGKLSYQVDILESNAELAAVFGRAQYFDRDGRPVDKSTMQFGTVFDQENRSRGAWLRRFFDHGNCLCHPTMLIRSGVYQQIGTYDNRYRQLPDFEMWVRFIRRWQFHISDRELINFRILPGENASSHTPANSIRTMNEHYMIAREFFDGVSSELLVEAFGDRLVHNPIPSDVHADIEKALLFFGYNQWLGHMYKVVGVTKLFDLLASPSHREVLQKDYALDDRAFHKLMGEADAFRPGNPLTLMPGRVLVQELKQRIRRRLSR
ncbi:glycosyltransferase [Ralstonia sp. 25C]|uniref:glycosyltransferase n=1 Tax=Ralstonia sp. 25C TaxID=3447363 RepID=UPI003F74BADF